MNGHAAWDCCPDSLGLVQTPESMQEIINDNLAIILIVYCSILCCMNCINNIKWQCVKYKQYYPEVRNSVFSAFLTLAREAVK